MTDIGIRSSSLSWSRADEAKAPADETKQFQLIFAFSFVLFLAIVAMTRLLGPRWRLWPSSTEGRQSIIQEARAAANTFIPFAFMG
jgi:hypothetical protein